ncbi:hypothetical protein BJ993_003380 [Nocardioides aromaticivorans]|uniref:Uncharacterized protein n=1 Tax=Nocardioides aromaticivorans TaxID=200618 RepID=A0A7Y9ZLU2_9ACTN|nr:hypothetical protein [Nocardioides aromaticivorans]NYI46300.1 hypothetical protein [Nocardioides aromaticivorans]
MDDIDEDRLLIEFAALTWEALVQFSIDPSYAADMVEAANEVDARTCPECGWTVAKAQMLRLHVGSATCLKRQHPDVPKKRGRPKRDVPTPRPKKPAPQPKVAVPRALSTHCKNGHEFTPKNTGTNRGSRMCLTCRKASFAAFYARRAEKLRKERAEDDVVSVQKSKA